MRPYRFQVRRQKGWRKPEGGIIVSRPSKFGNPYKISKGLSRDESVAKFEAWLMAIPAKEREDFLGPLRGRPLGCWCPLNAKCHADVLLKWANV